MGELISGARRVLILDDDEDVNFTVAAIARQAGFEPLATTSPQAFLQAAADWSPSHVIVDLAMPNVDGVQTLSRLAQQGCDATVIISSGLGSRVLDAAARAARENGLWVAGILPKPFRPALLREMLESPRPAAKPAVRSSPGPVVVPEFSPADISSALEARQFTVNYQPKVSLGTGEVIGFEALARWAHPEHGLVSPARFIPAAERSGQIRELTRQVFEEAVNWFDESFGRTNLEICLNVSAVVLADPGFLDWLERLCSDRSVHPSRVNLEITETATAGDTVAILEHLTHLRIRGFALSIDDFGIGYSSLEQLARLPFSEVKIDKGFVTHSLRSEERRTMVIAIIDLARALGLKTTAEGVEDEQTLTFLRTASCDLAQGYWISKPLSGDAVGPWMGDFQTLPPIEHDA